MKKILISFFICFTTATSGAGSGNCALLFIDNESERTIIELAELRLKLDLAKVDNGNTLANSALEKEYRVKEQRLFGYLVNNNLLSLEDAKGKLKTEILRIQKNDALIREGKGRQNKELMDNAAINGTKAILRRVEEGEFKRGNALTVVKPFDLMATPTTNIIWRNIGELAKKYFGDEFNITLKPSQVDDDKVPVTNISYNEVSVWMRSLNKLSVVGAEELNAIIPGHQSGDFYELPSAFEIDFVISNRGKTNHRYGVVNDFQDLEKYAWVNQDKDAIYPVAQKAPIVVGGNEFYDMVGNVWQYTNGLIKYFSDEQTEVIVKGGSAKSILVRVNEAELVLVSSKSLYRGFRFLRRVKK